MPARKPIIWLHIGAPKTGTTALQLALEAAGPALLEHDWYYPQAGRLGPGHHHLARAVSFSKQVPRAPGSYFDDLRNEVLAVRPCRTIISSEDFYLDCNVDALKGHLDWADVKVLVFLRSPTEWINSYFAQYIKDPDFRFHTSDSDQFNVEARLAKFAEPMRLFRFVDAFGLTSFFAQSYDSPEAKSDLVAAACNVTGLPLSVLKSAFRDERANTSLDVKALELVRQSNILHTDEQPRDRWLYELQSLPAPLDCKQGGKVPKHDIGLSEPSNDAALKRISQQTDELVRGGQGILGGFNANAGVKLQLRAGSVTLDNADIARITAGLSARQNVLFDGIDNSFAELSTASKPEQPSQADGKPSQSSGVWSIQNRWVGLVPNVYAEDRDAFVLSERFADPFCPAARLGIVSLLELGLYAGATMFIESIGPNGKRYARIRSRKHLFAWAAGRFDAFELDHLYQFKRVFVAPRSMVALGPFSNKAIAGLSVAEDAIAVVLCAQTTKKGWDRSILSGSRGAQIDKLRFVPAPLFLEPKTGNFKYLSVKNTFSGIKKKAVVIPSAARLPSGDSVPKNDADFMEAAVQKLGLNSFYRDLLNEQFLTAAASIRLIAERRLVS